MATEQVSLQAMELSELQENASNACALLKCMANEARLLIMCHLAEGEKSVGEMQQLLGLSQSALSQHLAILRRENLVETRRAGQFIYYAIASQEAQTLMGTLHELYCQVPAD